MQRLHRLKCRCVGNLAPTHSVGVKHFRQSKRRYHQNVIILEQHQVAHLGNTTFHDLCIFQASSVKLPITAPVAMWTKLCDSTFSRLQVDVAQQVNDVDLLPHVPAALNRAEFEVAIQGTGLHGKGSSRSRLVLRDLVGRTWMGCACR